jgi:RNA polymerase sigma-70 factor, ECF subfamily
MSEGINQPASQDELHLIQMLPNGNEEAFIFLIDRYHTTMLRLAMIYVPVHAVAEEVVQEAWLRVLQGLNRPASVPSSRCMILKVGHQKKSVV